MACFLCAYGRNRVPKTPDTPASTIPPPRDVGTCQRCSVHACSRHGARVGQFICAICEGADVVEHAIVSEAVTVGAGSGGGLSKARLIGAGAPDSVITLVGEALRRITQDSDVQPGPSDRLELASPGAGSPNLVFNLSESIREVGGEQAGFRNDVAEAPERGVSIDAISDVVRERFVGRQIVFTDAAAPAVTGALVIAVRVAHEPDVSIEDAVRLAPWEMSDPLLLDPVMWMVSTAVRQVTMGLGPVPA